MGSKPATESLALYAAIMDEVKIRLRCVEYGVAGKTGLDAQLVREICFLQLRMACELVALGCLVVHGDIPATQAKRFQKNFSADDILRGLERLHADFFPKPLLFRRMAPGRVHFESREPDYMTKEELLTLYGKECGAALHKGTLRGLMKPLPPVEPHLPEVMVPAQRLMNLLSLHRMHLFNGDQFLCWLHYGPEENVHTALAGRVEDQ